MIYSNDGLLYDPLCQGCPLAFRTMVVIKDCPKCKKLLEEDDKKKSLIEN